ncbi:MAG TPA: murein biosynthesis integral membrane protein MurJ [Tepidisphaeraceae bacterium]|jgi:putative peptidoglycan lipid II flippase|nr:murein biosynthesis integral membrane protein MurJ [Tepidisphaeraceae bacterium]
MSIEIGTISDQTHGVPTPSVEPKSVTERSAGSFLGHAKLIGGLTLASRVFGLLREIVAGHYLGTGLVASAFTVAFTIPNLFRKLFGEGALSAAFIPLYTQAVKEEKGSAVGVQVSGMREHPAHSGPVLNPEPRTLNPRSVLSPQSSVLPPSTAFAAAAVNLLCVLLLGITVVGEVGLGALIYFSHGMRPERMLMLKLTAIMLPYVLLICGGAFLSGILQVHKRFGPPAAAPIILNLIHILVLLIGAAMLHLHASTPEAQAEVLQTKLAYWLAGFVLVAGVLQVQVLLPGLRAVGFRFQPVLAFWTPAIRKMLLLSLPVALGAGVLQISVLLDKGISMMLMRGEDALGNPITQFSFLGHLVNYPMEAGAPRRLDIAQYLYQFPLGIFAIALATAIFPRLSSDALEKDRNGFRTVVRQGIEASLWEGLPASVGLVLVRMPAIRLLFQHGHIHPHDAELIGSSLLFYASAIWAFSMLQIINRAYYAIHDTVTPLVMSVVNIVLNLAVEIPLLWWLGESAMALGTVVSFAIQAVVMLWMLDRKVGGLGLGKIAGPVLKMIVATAVMGSACYFVQRVPGFPHGERRIIWTAQLVIIMLVGAIVYVGMCAAMGLGMIEHLRPKRKAAR